MRAAILLKINPGCQEKSFDTLKSLFIESDPIKGLEVETLARYTGKWDAIVTLKCVDKESLDVMMGILKRDGTFYTETLISVE